jgi:hypothetical protein
MGTICNRRLMDTNRPASSSCLRLFLYLHTKRSPSSLTTLIQRLGQKFRRLRHPNVPKSAALGRCVG